MKPNEGNIEDDYLIEDCPVPKDQQPIQELKEIEKMPFMQWATRPYPEFLSRVGWTFFIFFSFIGYPIAAVTFEPSQYPIQCIAGATAGTLVPLFIIVLRIYLGWFHVSRRLNSKTVEYEESGWYDGQIWTKSENILLRDRLADDYTVSPALKRLKSALLTVSGGFVSALLIINLLPSPNSANNSVDDRLNNDIVYVRAFEEKIEDYYDRINKLEPYEFNHYFNN